MCLQPGSALFGWRIMPGIARSRRVLGQVAVQRLHSDLPVVLGVGRAPPAGTVRAIEAAITKGRTVADRAGCGDPGPRFRPGVRRPAGRFGAAGRQVVADAEDGRTGVLGGAAAVAGLVAADVMRLAVHMDDVPG